MQHAACSRDQEQQRGPVLGSETWFRPCWAGIRPRDLLLKPSAPQAPGFLDRGQAKLGSWVRPDRPAMPAQPGFDRGWEGPRQAYLPACRGPWAGSHLPPPTAHSRSTFPKAVEQEARIAWRPHPVQPEPLGTRGREVQVLALPEAMRGLAATGSL